MDIETVLMQYKNVIHYEVSRVLYEQIDLWDEAIQETFIRINASLPSIVEKDGKYYLYAYIKETKGCVAVADRPERRKISGKLCPSDCKECSSYNPIKEEYLPCQKFISGRVERKS